MPKLNAKDILIPTVALVLICGISTGLLAGTNEMTKEPIAQAEIQSQNDSIMLVSADTAADFKTVETSDDSAQCFEVYDSSGTLLSYAVATSSKGYGGTIKVMTGIDAETGDVIGVNVYDNSTETPGLGAKTSEDDFSGQFGGSQSDTGFTVSKDADKNPDKTSVDAVTGATISSRAVVKAVNQAIDVFKQVSGGAE